MGLYFRKRNWFVWFSWFDCYSWTQDIPYKVLLWQLNASANTGSTISIQMDVLQRAGPCGYNPIYSTISIPGSTMLCSGNSMFPPRWLMLSQVCVQDLEDSPSPLFLLTSRLTKPCCSKLISEWLHYEWTFHLNGFIASLPVHLQL